MKTINWKKKYEETAGLLKLARDGNELLQQKFLAERPVVEKIVEKEVLPFWHVAYVLGICAVATAICLWCRDAVKKLETPIKEPYPVYVAKYVPPDPYALDVCKDAWRADERELRKLRKNQKEN